MTIFVLPVQPATAAGGHSVSFVLGQYHADGSPSFDDRGINNRSSIGAVGFNYLAGLDIDPVRHLLFVGDQENNRVLIFQCDSSNTPLDGTADYVLGQPDMTSNGWGLSAQNMDSPGGVAYEPGTKRLFVSDTDNHRVLVFDVTTLSNNPSAIAVLGQPDFTSNGIGTTSSTLHHRWSLSLDLTGRRLFVADGENNRVLVFDVSSPTTNAAAINVLGQPDFTSSGAATTATGISLPQYTVWDGTTQRLFVTDFNNSRVLVYNAAAITNGMAASNELGQPDFTSSGANNTQWGFSNVNGITLDPVGQRLWVSDLFQRRILQFDVSTVTNGENAVDVFGHSDYVSTGYGVAADALDTPEGVLYDPTSGRIFVSDANNMRVVAFDVGISGASNVSAITAVVAPSMTFSVAAAPSCNGVNATTGATSGPTSVALGHATVGSTAIGAQQLTAATNAGSGVLVLARSSGPLAGGGHTIADVGGSNGAPSAFPAVGTEAFGYTTDAMLSSGTSNRFVSGGAKWAALTATSAEVVYRNAPGSSVSCMAYQVGLNAGTAAGTYNTTVVYTAVPTF